MPAISKSEVRKILSEQDKKALDKLENYINGFLQKDYTPGSYSTLELSELEKVSSKAEEDYILDRIASDYRAKGWKVKIEHDQRDDSFISFS